MAYNKKRKSKNAAQRAKRAATKTVKKYPFLVFVLAFVIIAIAVFSFYAYKKYSDVNKTVKGELTVHFLELGNEYAGDSIYIKAGETDILVDAGSRAGSVSTISKYLNDYVTDGKLEYVIATHADQDHIAGFAASNGIFDLYDCETIIDFPKTNKTTDVYNKYVQKRDKEVVDGAKHYTALECYNNENGAQREYSLSYGITLKILYNYYYEHNSTDENNYSVCFLITQGSRNFLFTGDLEKSGEEYLVENNDLPEVELFKAGHHGSKTSSNDCLLRVIKPKIVCVCCCAGSVEYTQNFNNTFPTQDFIDRVAVYTDKVYVNTYINVKYDSLKDKYVNDGDYLLLNGNIVISSCENKEVEVICSNNNTLLKDTEWIKNNRTIPDQWK